MEGDSDVGESADEFETVPYVTDQDVSAVGEENQERLSARPYQVELLNKALERNIVVCLGTGTGKTFISVLLIKELSHEIRKDYEDGGKRTFFLVNTVPLVNQQHKVIVQNTDLSVGTYVGENGVDFWGKEKWLEELKKNQVLVMTAQIFVDMLGHGKIQLSRVNLIVFDECHHAKKEHPYAQVMRYFTGYKLSEHPRVLGLTASIVNGKVKPHRIEQEITNLERTLRASCETSSDECVGQFATKPEEISIPYSTKEDVSAEERELQDRLQQEVLTPWQEFLDDVRNKSDVHALAKSIVKECAETLEVLGASAANRVAEYFLEVTERYSKVRLLSNDYAEWLMEYSSTQLRQIQKIYKNYKTKLYGSDYGSIQHVSAKVKALVEVLKQYGTAEDSNTQLCGIVFVQRRCTAAVLCEQINLLSKHDEELSFVKCEYVVGHGMVGTAASSAKDMSCKKQDKVLRKFRNREFNLLIATSVVEEGLDVPRCNLVVRFDFPMTFQSYVQSKGRARAKDSFYIMLLPDGQDGGELEMYHAIEEYLSNVCYDRPTPTDEESNEAVDTDLLRPYRTEKGASVTMANSIAMLCKYCSNLPGDRFTPLNPDFKTVEVGKDAFQTTLTMPMNCPIKEKIVGDAMPTKKQAKMAAAYNSCVRLHQDRELDDYLFPVESLSDESDEEDQNAEMAGEKGQAKAGTKRKKQLYQRKIPDVFQGSLPTGPRDRCYLYAFTRSYDKPTHNHLAEEEVLKLGILMTTKLPQIRRFTLHLDEGPVTVSVVPGRTQRLTSPQLTLIDQFHTRISSEVLRQSFERQFSDGYYIVPVKMPPGKKVGGFEIDFDRAKDVLRRTEGVIEISSMEELWEGDSIISPIHRPRERFIVEKICTSLSPLSAFPERSKAKTYEEYFRKEYPSLKKITRRDQPLILVKSMPQKINFLVDRKKSKSKEKLKKDIHFIPELCFLEPFSAQLLLEARELPSILYRMTSLLLVLEMKTLIAEGCRPEAKGCEVEQNEEDLTVIGGEPALRNEAPSKSLRSFSPKTNRSKYNKEFESISKNLARLFSNGQENLLYPDSALLLQALTTKGAGDAFDLERLEMLGDAFLKQAVSIYLFCFYTNKDEGKLTRRKIREISNLKLYKVSTAHNLPGYMQTTNLDRKTWAPPSLKVKQQGATKVPQEKALSKKAAKRQKLNSESKQDDLTKQTISDKSVADSIEALIGAYLVSCGYKGALYFLDYLGIKVLPDQDETERSDFTASVYATFSVPPCDPLPFVGAEDLDVLNVELRGFEHRINYEFRNKIYLAQALTHASYAHNKVTPDCYQRLEFLGDAVLDFLVTECLYSRNQKLSPGELTDLRQALVNNNIFAKIAVEHGYHLYLKQTSPEWFKKIGDFVQKLEDEKDDDEEEEGRPKISDDPFLIMSDKDDEAVEAPKVLGDIFESVAGAVFLDSGMDVVVTWKVYYRMMKPYIDYYSENVPYNPIRLVHESDSDLKFSDARILDDGKIECDLKVYWGKFTGRGANKRIAKAAASRRAIDELKLKNQRETQSVD